MAPRATAHPTNPPLPARATPRRRAIARLLAVLLALALLPGLAFAADSAVETMARVMARMMEAMGLFDEHGGGGAMGFGTSPFALGDLGQMPWTSNPWTDPFADPRRAFGMDHWMRQMPGFGDFMGTSLDGVWEGRDGGLLIIQRHRFRLQAAQGGHLEGLIQQRGNRLALYEPGTETVRPYEFVEEQGRLILRDPAGRLYLYRRLWLDDDPFPAGQR